MGPYYLVARFSNKTFVLSLPFSLLDIVVVYIHTLNQNGRPNLTSLWHPLVKFIGLLDVLEFYWHDCITTDLTSTGSKMSYLQFHL
jgi:hypothetical protein